jgi:hypothetical protein
VLAALEAGGVALGSSAADAGMDKDAIHKIIRAELFLRRDMLFILNFLSLV